MDRAAQRSFRRWTKYGDYGLDSNNPDHVAAYELARRRTPRPKPELVLYFARRLESADLQNPAEPVSPDDDPVPSASSAPGARAAPCTTPEASAAPCASAAPGASAAGAAGVGRPLPPSFAMERVLKSLRNETLPV